MKKGQTIFWRWKRKNGMGYSAYSEATIMGVHGDLITFNPNYESCQSWLDTKEMDIKK